MARRRTVNWAGTLAVALLVLVVGSRPLVEWIEKHSSSASPVGWFLGVLAWPRWAAGAENPTNYGKHVMIALDLRAALLILFVAMILRYTTKGVSRRGAFFLGWASVVFGAALAGFLAAFAFVSPSLLSALESGAQGSQYGLYAGWIVGAITASGEVPR